MNNTWHQTCTSDYAGCEVKAHCRQKWLLVKEENYKIPRLGKNGMIRYAVPKLKF